MMIVGLSIPAFTLLHVILSLAGIGAGLIMIFALAGNKFSRGLHVFFMSTTALTSITGFLFPFHGVTPGIVLGILSIIVLLLVEIALYGGKLRSGWRGTYVICVALAEWFNGFVLFAQLFAKVPALKAIAPTQSSPAFGLTQLAVLVIFIVITVRAFKGFRGSSVASIL